MASTRTKRLMASLAAATLLLGCADVPSTGPTPPDLRAEFRFMHAAPELGAVQVSVDGVGQGSVDFSNSTPRSNFPAGSRSISLSNGESQFVAMATDLRGTVVLLPAAPGAPREFFRMAERRIFDTPQTALRLINFNPDRSVVVNINSGTTAVATFTLGYKESSGYQAVNAGNYIIEVKETETDTIALATTSVNVTTSHTTAILGNASSVVLSNLVDN
ncbi:MAG: hypothetical protein ACREOO_03485 [bacterium]